MHFRNMEALLFCLVCKIYGCVSEYFLNEWNKPNPTTLADKFSYCLPLPESFIPQSACTSYTAASLKPFVQSVQLRSADTLFHCHLSFLCAAFYGWSTCELHMKSPEIAKWKLHLQQGFRRDPLLLLLH